MHPGSTQIATYVPDMDRKIFTQLSPFFLKANVQATDNDQDINIYFPNSYSYNYITHGPVKILRTWPVGYETFPLLFFTMQPIILIFGYSHVTSIVRFRIFLFNFTLPTAEKISLGKKPTAFPQAHFYGIS